jgi:hypothetical protein
MHLRAPRKSPPGRDGCGFGSNPVAPTDIPSAHGPTSRRRRGPLGATPCGRLPVPRPVRPGPGGPCRSVARFGAAGPDALRRNYEYEAIRLLREASAAGFRDEGRLPAEPLPARLRPVAPIPGALMRRRVSHPSVRPPVIGGSAPGRGPQTNRRATAGDLAQGPCGGRFSKASASAWKAFNSCFWAEARLSGSS